MSTKLEAKLKCLIAKRESYFSYVQTLYNERTGLKDATSQKAFKAKCQNLDYVRQAFVETVSEINSASMELDPDKYTPDFKSVESFLEILGHVQSIQDKLKDKPTSSSVVESPKVKLPTLDLPMFDGENLFQWEVFFQSFKSMIHNNATLTNDQKVQYLVSKLSGKALSMISGTPATGDNYQCIYDSLVDRYNDQRTLASYYIDQLLSFKPLKGETVDQLNNFLDKYCAAVKGLQTLNIRDLSGFMLGYIGASKLDSETARQYQLCSKDIPIPTFDNLLSFVKDHVKVLRGIQGSSFSSGPKSGTSYSKPKVTHSFIVNDKPSHSVTHTFNACLFCNKQKHPLYMCEKFKHSPVTQRHSFVKSQGICFNCLSPKHRLQDCRLKTNCSKCNMRHNSLLHFDSQPNPNVFRNSGVVHSSASNACDPHSNGTGEGNSRVETSQPSTLSMCTHSTESSGVVETTVLLGTVKVNIFDHVGQIHSMRMLLDSGSQSQFLSQAAARELGLVVSKVPASVKGICGSTSAVKGTTSFTFTSHLTNNVKYSTEAYVVSQILDKIPSCALDTKHLTHLTGLPLADTEFHKPGVVHGIIGANLFAQVLESGKVTGSAQAPIAIRTSLGYVVMGSVPILAHSVPEPFCGFLEQPLLETTLSKFFELEEVPQPQYLNQDDKICEEFFQLTHSRDTSGRYCVRLPFCEPPSVLGNSKEIARRRFLSLEKKLSTCEDLHDKYHAAIQEFIDLGFLTLITDESEGGYYIPHHAVVRPDKVTTKVRCVMDASCKTTSGKSLNDILYTGEKLYTELLSILLQFRMHSIAMTADIKKMFCQVLMHPDDHKYQRILWRSTPDGPIQNYELNRVVFGVKPSPYLSQRVLKQLSIDEAEKYPVASPRVCTNFYMDDFVCSVENISEAQELQTQMVNICQSGGFELVKWSTNSQPLLQSIPEDNRLSAHVNFESDMTIKILGLQWQALDDYFYFNVNWSDRPCTKRSVLSAISTIFDPLGFLQPTILCCKLLISDLWKEKIDWDESPPTDMCDRWQLFQSQLCELSQLKIPRPLYLSSTHSILLIGFADASEKAYAAVIYSRSVSPSGEVTVGLVCSKSKVAPLKTESIPRLELCAGLLLSNLMQSVVKTFSPLVNLSQVLCFLDSTVALDWIHSSPHRWAPFVANRVSKIQHNVDPKQWYHVAGKENPADCVSRGLLPSELVQHRLFYDGPPWLTLPQEQWSLSDYSVSDPSTHLEARKSELTCALVNTNTAEDLIGNLSLRFSSWTKFLRCVVYILRFVHLLPQKSAIELSDLQVAEDRVIKSVQQKHFASDIRALQKGELCSPLVSKLNPFLHNGIIRVGGRLNNSQLGYEQCHPILLPKNNQVVNLLIDHYHRVNLHTGPYLLLSLLRQRYWILSGRSEVKKRVHKCNTCFKVKPNTVSAKMADLPTYRVQQCAKPFVHTGVDYCGPFSVTMAKGRGIKSCRKAYVCLFICLTTKAVHIELASDLSTETFLNCFKRFLSRRGCCQVMYSDNGTNFIGAKNSLDELYNLLVSNDYQSRLMEQLNISRIQWKTIPPHAPHMGGIWESQMRPMKAHLMRVVGLQILTFEEFTTVLTQIEALLNSRPLCQLSADPDTLSVLTPAHFLHSEPLKWLPAEDVSTLSHVSRHQLLDQLVQCYWKRWTQEYLHQLQSREKWNSDQHPVKVGDVVIIVQDNSPVLSWPLGVVQEVYPGKDGVIRTVLVKTKGGCLKRPVVKLCPLPSQ
ncbi:uncharacterized protein LOC103519612 [Diaphorina citri]|uniref:Uncharacterized protein LOC103519612 n=2 Tax=Diaphorina citri TaxID=121845 RepID=A0A1S3DJC0_DIACI|nr:uncharacterized protein LOC103519612 [Diaphorina citri]